MRGVQRTVLRDHLQAARGVQLRVAAVPHVQVHVGADTVAQAVQGVGEEDPLVLDLENPARQPGVVLVVLSAKQVPHPEVVNDVGGGRGGVLETHSFSRRVVAQVQHTLLLRATL